MENPNHGLHGLHGYEFTIYEPKPNVGIAIGLALRYTGVWGTGILWRGGGFLFSLRLVPYAVLRARNFCTARWRTLRSKAVSPLRSATAVHDAAKFAERVAEREPPVTKGGGDLSQLISPNIT